MIGLQRILRECAACILMTANLQMKIPTQQRIWDTTSTPKLWEKGERTYWIGPKLYLKRSPEKQRKGAKKFLEVPVEQEIPSHSVTCVSENTATALETTANFGNCKSSL